MFHTEGFWLRTLRLNPLKPFGSRCCVAALQAEKHRSALPTGPIQASGLTEAASWDSSGHFRHNDDRQGVTIAYWVLVQGTGLAEDHAAAGRDLHTRDPLVRCLVDAE